MATKKAAPQIDMSFDLGKSWDPVSELMRAMILRAIEDYQSKPELKQAAIDYINSQNEDYILSFRFICRHFGLDPDQTKKAIMSNNKRISTRRRAA